MRAAAKLTFHIISSKTFWVGAPMIISEILKRGHYISVFDENMLPTPVRLLQCDVLIDMSTITKPSFYLALEREFNKRKQTDKKVPLVVDPPKAVLNSLDKRKTHDMFPDLIPESYVLNGRNNAVKINKFKNDKFVVVKQPVGWWGIGVERISPVSALEKYKTAKGLIVQKYVPYQQGVGRIVTINHAGDFEIACSYLRIPRSWRTGVDVEYTCVIEPVSKKLKEFAEHISKVCGLYLNGIDYIFANGRYVLLEINAVPAMKEPLDEFAINIPAKLISHIERNLGISK
jgi:glutathione synthase/RimK-type ligase-like ATP-grasp enzyme